MNHAMPSTFHSVSVFSNHAADQNNIHKNTQYSQSSFFNYFNGILLFYFLLFCYKEVGHCISGNHAIGSHPKKFENHWNTSLELTIKITYKLRVDNQNYLQA